MTRVYLEVGARKVFACALDWPGWCRAGTGEEAALSALANYASRHTAAAERAGVIFDAEREAALFDVVERVVPFVARRTAWHSLDHAWEIEDRSGGPAG